MSEELSTQISKKHFTTKELVLTALFAAIISICSWIAIPLPAVAMTMQTFGIFCALELLGGRNGLFSVLVWILLGAVGLPVFTGFKGGAGVLVGPTGGYILGFVLMAAIYWLGTGIAGKKIPTRAASMLTGLAICYLFGTLWFVYGYSKNGNEMTFIKAMKLCVTPFVPFDLIKLVLAIVIAERIKKSIKLQ